MSLETGKCMKAKRRRRAAMTHFGSKEQAKLLQISQNGARHTRAAMTHFWSEEQDKYAMVSMAFKSLGKYLKHTKMVALCFL